MINHTVSAIFLLLLLAKRIREKAVRRIGR